jgi:TRAP-type mannitol/chloroaromatic compound transport system permease small subunit
MASSRPRALAAALAAALDRASLACAWLVLPLALLLFAQWPLRDLVGAWSRQANDAAQWMFALYVALAVRAATRSRAHMAAGLVRGESAGVWRRRIDRIGEAVCVLPWALFVLVAGAAQTWRSLLGLEAFPDTFNPLYFVVRCSAWLLALGIALQAVLDLVVAREPNRAPPAAP